MELPTLNRKRGIAYTALLAAAALSGAGLFVRSKTRRTEQENPPAGNFLEVDGVRLHYVERGQGQPLVLLHGNGSMIQDFELSGLLDLASKQYRVIAFDRPGYGYSKRPRSTIWNPLAQAELLHKALQQLGAESPIIVGHSWGTLVALAIALEYPVHSLVLLSGYYFPTFRIDVPLVSPPAIPIVGDVMRYTISPLIGRLLWPGVLRIIFGPAPVPPLFAAKFAAWMVLRPSQLRAAAAESALLIPYAIALGRRYHELTLPVVIMAGAKDRYADPHTHSVRLHRALPQSELKLISGAGHMIHHTAPRQVMAAIEAVAQPA